MSNLGVSFDDVVSATTGKRLISTAQANKLSSIEDDATRDLIGELAFSQQLVVQNSVTAINQAKILGSNPTNIEIGLSQENAALVRVGIYINIRAGSGLNDAGSELVICRVDGVTKTSVGSDPLDPDFVRCVITGPIEKGFDEKGDELNPIAFGAVGQNVEFRFLTRRDLYETPVIEDSLTSNDPDKTLSANQGRVIKSLIDNNEDMTETSRPLIFAWDGTVGNPTDGDKVDFGPAGQFPSLVSENGSSLTNNAVWQASDNRVRLTAASSSQRGALSFERASPDSGKSFTVQFSIEPHNNNVNGLADGIGFFVNCSAVPTTNDITNSDSEYVDHDGVMIFINTFSQRFELHFGNETKANQLVHTVNFFGDFSKAYFGDEEKHVLRGYILDKRIVAFVDDVEVIDYELDSKDLPAGGDLFGVMSRTGSSFSAHYLHYLSIGNIEANTVDFDNGIRRVPGVSGAGGMFEQVQTYTSSQTLTQSTQGVIRFTGTSAATFTLPSGLTSLDEWAAFFSNDSATATVTVSGSFSTGVNGVFLNPQEGQVVYWDGSEFAEGPIRDVITVGSFPEFPANTLTRGKSWSNNGESGTISSTGINMDGVSDADWDGMRNHTLRFQLSGGSFLIDMQRWSRVSVGEGIGVVNSSASNIPITIRPDGAEGIFNGSTEYTFGSGLRVNPGASVTFVKTAINGRWEVTASSGSIAGGTGGGAGGNSGSGLSLSDVEEQIEYDNLFERANNGTGTSIDYGAPVKFEVEDGKKGVQLAGSTHMVDGLCGTSLPDNTRGRILIAGELIDYDGQVYGNNGGANAKQAVPISSGASLYWDHTNSRYTTVATSNRYIGKVTTSGFRLPSSGQTLSADLNINSQGEIDTYLNKSTIGLSGSPEVTLPAIGEGATLNDSVSEGDGFIFAVSQGTTLLDITVPSGQGFKQSNGTSDVTGSVYRLVSSTEDEGVFVYRDGDNWRLGVLNTDLLLTTFMFHAQKNINDDFEARIAALEV